MKKLFFAFIFIPIVLAVSFGLGEGLLRLYFSKVIIYDMEMHKYALELKRPSSIKGISHEHIPHAKAKLMGVDVSINNLGYRGRDFDLKTSKENNEFRILVLGSSITFGWGVPYEQIFTTLVEKRLNDNNVTINGRPIRILNAGIGNFNTLYESILLEHEYSKFEPDLVVTHFFLRDAELLKSDSQNWMVKNSYLAALCYVRFQQFQTTNNKNYISLGDYYRQLYLPKSEGWKTCRESLLKIQQLCSAKGSRCIALIQPELNDLNPESPQEKAYNEVCLFLRENKMDYHDLVPYLRKTSDTKSLWNQSDDSHPNGNGHALMAEGFYDALIQHINNN